MDSSKPPNTDILLVEDTPSDAELLIRLIHKDHPNLAVEVLHDGEAALNMFFDHDGTFQYPHPDFPKLMLLDLKLPKVSGQEVLKKMKRDPSTCHLPVVVLTSSSEDRDAKVCYENGANSYLVKPIVYKDYRKLLWLINEYWIATNHRCW